MPSDLNSTKVYADQLTLMWSQGISDAKAYIKYAPDNDEQNPVSLTGSSPLTITGLKNGTKYEFRVGIYSKDRGGSEWSDKYSVYTTNGKINIE